MSTGHTTYKSLTGGETWVDESIPEYYMLSGGYVFPKNVGEVIITIHNNSDNELLTSPGFRLFVWDGTDWKPSPADGLHHTDEGYYVLPGEQRVMPCNFQEKTLDAGVYKLTKEAQLPDSNGGSVLFSIEFELS